MDNSFLHGETKIKFRLKIYFCQFQGKVFSAFLKGMERWGRGVQPPKEKLILEDWVF